MSVRYPGQVIGTPGGSLAGATFTANEAVGRIGAKGERRTAEILNQLAHAPGGPSILHDLSIPIKGVNANVDHVVVSGRTVTIIDTKVWAGAFYWTLAGRTYRGWKRFATTGKAGVSYPAEKRTLPMARDSYAKYLGTPVADVKISLIVWPSSKTPLNLTLFAGAGNPKTVDGTKLTVGRAGRLYGRRPADANLLSALAKLTK
ncbi:nuclease-related domain-containing protein [Glaciihabitans sp. INWT7]|uniref:nuclease-related domain-containing protein n=1 Tax=Glaciihabitans sp. INWT7 TaxID=2596912 RepID=UPI0016246837|nr:nuclease-related domain-containing protein [Glaciihabitans sp. INWT7]